MKKSLIALAVTAVAGIASAQSSVTIFGVTDVNIRNVKNSGVAGNTTMSGGGLSSNRFGFRGVEDLGGGLKAGFWLESDINVDSGTTNANGKLFARRSTASLMGNWGELRLGRDLMPSGAHSYIYDPFGVIGVGGSNNTSRMPALSPTYYRSDNAVQYFSPNLSGFQAQFSWAPDESGVNNVNRYVGTRLSYGAGPLSVSASYGSTNLAVGKYQSVGLAGSYDLGVVKLMSHYYRDKIAGSATPEEKRFLVGVTVPMGAGEVRASYVRSDATGGTAAYNASDASQLALGYTHNLSKRTALYTTFARISNKGGATFAVSGGTPGITAGGNSTAYEFGMRHSF